MPFRLKNVGSTFARVIQNGFEPQLHRNLEACMDDIVVKTKDKSTLVQDLEETFANLHKINLKLNTSASSVSHVENLLDFSCPNAIEAKPNEIKAIEQIETPKRVKDVRRLAGYVAAVSRFISKSAERALSFLKIL